MNNCCCEVSIEYSPYAELRLGLLDMLPETEAIVRPILFNPQLRQAANVIRNTIPGVTTEEAMAGLELLKLCAELEDRLNTGLYYHRLYCAAVKLELLVSCRRTIIDIEGHCHPLPTQ